MHVQGSSYRGRFNALLSEAQTREKHLGGFRVRFREGGNSLHLRDDDRDEKRDGRIHSREVDDSHGDDVVLLPSTGPL